MRDDLIADCLAANHALTFPTDSEALGQRLAYLEKSFRDSPRNSAQRAALGYAYKNMRKDAAERAYARGVEHLEDSQCLLRIVLWLDAHADLLITEGSAAAFTYLPDNIVEDYVETRRDLFERFRAASERERQQCEEILERASHRRSMNLARRRDEAAKEAEARRLALMPSGDLVNEAELDKLAEAWLGDTSKPARGDALSRLRVPYREDLAA